MEHLIKTGYIDLKSTLFCGQCFSWEEQADGSFVGAAGSGWAVVRQAEGGVMLTGIKQDELPFWERYFCADEDYPALLKLFSRDDTLRLATEYAPGIRLLRQEPFETLISFIISQNNNIKRITGIIKRLCELNPDVSSRAFPSASWLAELEPDDLAPIRAGFRARYIIDAARKVAGGKVMLDEIEKMTYNKGKGELMKIVGVGEKVADCVLLYGFHKTEAFPRDVWIKRVMSEYYPDGLPSCVKGYEGVAQLFLFHYIRGLNA